MSNEQLAVRLCLTVSLTMVFTGKDERMWEGIAKTMLITLSGHIDLAVSTLR